MNKKPEKWNERGWTDIESGWQFRTYKSPRNFQLCFIVDDMQGDGFVHVSIHLLKKALAFEFPFDKKSPQIRWRLIK
jgi:hypothetical protein